MLVLDWSYLDWVAIAERERATTKRLCRRVRDRSSASALVAPASALARMRSKIKEDQVVAASGGPVDVLDIDDGKVGGQVWFR